MEMTGHKPATAYDPYDDTTTYWTDGKTMYYRLEAIKGACIENFRHFPGWWATDGKHAYSQSTRLKQAGTFIPLNFTYARDETNVWTLAGRIPGADAASFEVCDSGRLSQGVMLRPGSKKEYESFVPYGFAKDKNQVYYYDYQGKTKIVKKAGPPAFRSLQDGYFGMDDQHVYCGAHILPKANPLTWRKLEEHYFYSRDDDRIYYFNRLIKGADAATFEVVKDDQPYGLPRQSAKDKNYNYKNDMQGTP